MAGADAANDCAHIAGDGGYAIEVVSGSSHQERLEWLGQGRGEEPVDYACTAFLLPEPDNPFDPHAVSVSIRGVPVGYLPADAAASMTAAMQSWGFQRATCAAIVEGGWYRSAEDKGDFCVRLDANPDFAPVALPVPVQRPQLPVAVIAAESTRRKTAYDLALGAIATVATLALIGIVWMVVSATQPVKGTYPDVMPAPSLAAAQTRQTRTASRDRTVEMMERAALLDYIGRPRRNGEGSAILIEARREPVTVIGPAHQLRASRPPTSPVRDLRPTAAVAEAAREVQAVPPPESRAALATAAAGRDAARRERVPVEATGESRASAVAVHAGDAEEVKPQERRQISAAMVAPSAREVSEAPRPVSSGSTLRAGKGDSHASAPLADISVKPAARGHRKGASRKTRSRVGARAARPKARLRKAPRHSRKNRPAVRTEQSQGPPPPQVVQPGLVPAARMLQGWTREWATMPRIQLRRRPAQQ